MEASRCPMVIEPLSFDFFQGAFLRRGGSCDGQGEGGKNQRDRSDMSVSLWAVRVGGWMGGGGCTDSTGVPRSLSKRQGPTARRPKRPGRTRIDLLLPEGARHEPGADAHRARSPRRPRGPCRRLLRHPHRCGALENFPITGTAISIYPDLVRALACVKQAAALANNALGLLPDGKAGAIERACEEIAKASSSIISSWTSSRAGPVTRPT